VAVACGGAADQSDDRLTVVATTTQIGDFARNVGGDRIDLTVLLRPNQDAHDFEPAPSQLRALERADLVLRNGIGLDAFVMDAVAGSSARVVVVTSGISARVVGAGGHAKEDEQDEADQESEEEAQGRDPHVWLSVDHARTMVAAIRDALAAADPENAPLYRDRADRYLTSLSQLDAAIRQEVASVPESCRKLVTNHDTLGYYAAAYGFTIVGSVIPSVDSEARPSASDVADIVRTILEQRVPAIFAETSINPALINQVGREAGVRVVSDLYGDSLGSKGSDGETYIKMMETNTKKIVGALRSC
jgi:ABC-type Zn uptake system ZnuABC Zn-binding protein ZnuA